MNGKKSQPTRRASILARLPAGTRHILSGAVVLACATGSAAPALAQELCPVPDRPCTGDAAVDDLLPEELELAKIEHPVRLICLDTYGCEEGLVQLPAGTTQEPVFVFAPGTDLAEIFEGKLSAIASFTSFGTKKEVEGAEVDRANACFTFDTKRGPVKNPEVCAAIVHGDFCDGMCGTFRRGDPLQTVPNPTMACADVQALVDEYLGPATEPVVWYVEASLEGTGEAGQTKLVACPPYQIQPEPLLLEGLESFRLTLYFASYFTPHGTYGGYTTTCCK